MELAYSKIEPKIPAKKAAELNGISVKTLIRWCKAGMPHFSISERKYLFLQSEIETWMTRFYRQNDNVYELHAKKTARGAR
jgi:predicted site-specific integrase-resolvase